MSKSVVRSQILTPGVLGAAIMSVGSWLTVFVACQLYGVPVGSALLHAAVFAGGALVASEVRRSLDKGRFEASAYLFALIVGASSGKYAADLHTIVAGAMFACMLVTLYCIIGFFGRMKGRFNFSWRHWRRSGSGNGLFHTQVPNIDTGPRMSRDRFVDEMIGRAEEVLGAVADAINDSPADEVVTHGVEKVRDLFAEFEREAIEMGIRMRMDLADGAHPPREG